MLTPLLLALFTLQDAPAEPAAPQIPVLELAGHRSEVDFVGFEPRGVRLYSAARGGTIHAWDSRARRDLWTVEGPESGFVGFDVDLRGNFVHATFGSSLLSERAGDDGRPLRSMDVAVLDVSRLACDPKGRFVWLGNEKGTTWRVDLAAQEKWKESHANDGVTALAGDPLGRTVAVGGRDGTVKFVTAESGLRTGGVLEGHAGPVNALAWDARGRTLVTGGADRTLRVWSMPAEAQRRAIEGHEAAVRAIAFDPRGRCIASGDESGTIKLWNPMTGAELASLRHASPTAASALAFSPDGRWLASNGAGSRVLVWDLENGL